MTMFIIQTAILLAVAFILGCLIGTLLKMFFGAKGTEHAATHKQTALVDNDKPAAAAKLVTASDANSGSAQPAKAQAKKTPAKKTPSKRAPVKAAATAAKSAKPAASKSKPAANTPAKASSGSTTKAATKSTAKTATRSRGAEKPAGKSPSGSTTSKASKAVQRDDLKRISGVGPKLEARMNAIDILTYEQIAKWTVKQQREFGEKLSFPGRIERDGWVKQAKLLAKGKDTEFSKRVDKGQVGSSKGKVAAAASLGKKPPVLKKEPAKGTGQFDPHRRCGQGA